MKKKWFKGVSRNQLCSALALQLQDGNAQFGQGSSLDFYLPSMYHCKATLCKLFRAAFFLIGLWNSSRRSCRLAFIPQKSVQVWQKEKLWKLPFSCFCFSKKLVSLPLLRTNVCPLKTQTIQPCVMGILLLEDLASLCISLLEQAEHLPPGHGPEPAGAWGSGRNGWFTFSWLSPRARSTAPTSRFLSLVLSDCRLMQSDRSGPFLAACTETWGFDRQLFLGNCLCKGYTQQRSAMTHFWCTHSISSSLETLWSLVSVCPNVPLGVELFGLWSPMRCLGDCSESQQPNTHPSHVLGHARGGWHGLCTLLPTSSVALGQSSHSCGVCLEEFVTASIPHSPAFSQNEFSSCAVTNSKLLPSSLALFPACFLINSAPSSESEGSRIPGLKNG